jgi:MFS family permease
VLGASPTFAGLALSCTSLGWPVGSQLCGRVVVNWGYRASGVIGAAVLTIGILALRQLTADSPLLLAAACNALCGFGFGFVMPTLLLAMQDAVGWSERGLVTGMNQFAANLGGTLGVAGAGSLFGAALSGGANLDEALRAAFAVFLAMALLSVAVTALLPAGRPRGGSSAPSSVSRTSAAM